MSKDLVLEQGDGKIVTTSLLVAEKFGKRHADVIRAIEGVISQTPESQSQRNFALSEYKDISGKSNRMYIMTKDAFSAVVLGFTGGQAIKFRWEFISAFNKMEEELKKPMTPLEYMQYSLNVMIEQDKRLSAVKKDMEDVKDKVNLLEAKSITSPENYFTVAGYSSLNRIPISREKAANLGKIASNICRKRGIDTGTVPDPRYGKVKTYPAEVLFELF
jgi:Rha family phage regulatory protein